ncbi:VWA domain-containing protein [Salmonella enterica subsp. enterica]|uniref:Mg-chelatase subunit ChlD n=1 Tax=Salmonella enterica TaxID=28901 RepID=A0A7D8EW52_SALER|nr:VWA domain-containing protein [Salmonella enterica]EDR2900278.1 VWA domain-containing protein [Salmonella enterica subsp. enterica serovar Amherstiana]SUF96708.1 Mg-chelatase subunit ChlD [Salmonella enterica]
MAYEAPISRNNPAAFLFVVDQSGSMSDKMSSGRSKAEFVADALNRTLMNLITRCTKSEGVRDYFEVGVLGYGGQGVSDGFSGLPGGQILSPISVLEQNPVRVEDRTRKMDDGAGGIVETTIKFPVWFGPVAGGGTPMREALTRAAEELVIWCDSHPESYPPTVLHVTDGESTDGDPEEIARHLRQIRTHDGEVLLFNIHVSSLGNDPVRFPSSDNVLPDDYARLLFRMSSYLPAHLIHFAQEKGHTVGAESRGFMFNAEAAELVDFFDIGTRASQLR